MEFWRILSLAFILIYWHISQSEQLVVRHDGCMKPLLGADLPDTAFTASSVKGKLAEFQPYRARIKSININPGENHGFAWCPEKPPASNLSEWIQVQFPRTKFLKAIMTFGRGDGNFNEYVPFFVIRYQREDGGPWFDYKEADGSKIITGNNDPRNMHSIRFQSMIIAKRFRIYPYDTKKVIQPMCLRFILYGCNFDDGVVEYSIPQGSIAVFPGYQDEYRLLDITYDGRVGPGGRLEGGMGQLMDNVAYTKPLTSDVDRKGTLPAGYHFVGWRRGQRDGLETVAMRFRFDTVRRFSRVRFYTFFSNNLNIGPFRQATFNFSVGGVVYDQREKSVVFQQESSLPSGEVDIPLNNRVGKFLQITLFFSLDRILLSEIVFTTEPVLTPVPVEVLPVPKPKPQPNGAETPRKDNGNKNNGGNPNGGTKDDQGTVPKTNGGNSDGEQSSKTGVNPPGEPGPSPGSPNPGGNVSTRKSDLTYIIAIVCCILGSLICAGLMAFIFLRLRRQRQKKTHGVGGTGLMLGVQTPGGYKQYPTDGILHFDTLRAAAMSNGGAGDVVTSAHRPLLKDTSLYTNVANTDSETDEYMSTIGKNTSMKRHSPERAALGPEYASTSLFSTPPPSYHSGTTGHLPVGMVGGHPLVYQGHQAYHPATSLYQPTNRHYPTLQMTSNPMVDPMDSRALYAGLASLRDARGAGLAVQIPPPPPAPLPPLPGDAGGALPTSIQGVTGNTVYASPREFTNGLTVGPSSGKDSSSGGSGCPSPAFDLSALKEIDLKRLRLLEKLGGGQFGEVHLAELEDEEETRLVAVKMLRKDAGDKARRLFETEIGTLSRLSDPNVSMLEGLVHADGSLFVLAQYGKHGELDRFLRSRRPAPGDMLGHHSQLADTSPEGDTAMTLSYGCLIYLAAQVASGMKHLETLGLVHRDLACRNCLVGSRFTVKIADFGMCRRLYATDYFRVDGRTFLPVRWMAWESVLQAKFSSKSDVWAFGVTLWEILTFCRAQPLSHMTNEEVVQNCEHVYAEDGLFECPPCPANSPKEIYDLMRECWRKSESQRPSFREIHMFLQRKNLGFNAEEEYQLTNASACTISNILT